MIQLFHKHKMTANYKTRHKSHKMQLQYSSLIASS